MKSPALIIKLLSTKSGRSSIPLRYEILAKLHRSRRHMPTSMLEPRPLVTVDDVGSNAGVSAFNLTASEEGGMASASADDGFRWVWTHTDGMDSHWWYGINTLVGMDFLNHVDS